MEVVDYTVKLSPGQITKLKKGLNVSLNKNHFSDDGHHKIRVGPLTQHKIASAIKKGRGFKMSLGNGEELIKTKMDKAIRHMRSMPNELNRFKISPVKRITLSSEADMDEPMNREGDGLYKFLSNKMGIKKRDAVQGLKVLGKAGLRAAATAASAALIAQGVPPEVASPIMGRLVKVGDNAIEKGTQKHLKRKVPRQLLTIAGDVAKEQAMKMATDALMDASEPNQSRDQEMDYYSGMMGGRRGDGFGRMHMKKQVITDFSPIEAMNSPAMHPLLIERNQIQGVNHLKKRSLLDEMAGKKRGSGLYPPGY